MKSPQYTDKNSKKKSSDSDFPYLCFDEPRASNFISGGVQNRETKNGRLRMIVTSFQGLKFLGKQISQTF